MTYRPKNNPYFNIYNVGWGAQPIFSWQPQPVVTALPQEPTFMDAHYDMPSRHYQSSPNNNESIFKEKIQQALEFTNQSLNKPKDQRLNSI